MAALSNKESTISRVIFLRFLAPTLTTLTAMTRPSYCIRGERKGRGKHSKCVRLSTEFEEEHFWVWIGERKKKTKHKNKTLSKRDLVFIFLSSVSLPCCCCHTLSHSQGVMGREAVHQHFTCTHWLLSGNKLTADWRKDTQALIWGTNNTAGNSQPSRHEKKPKKKEQKQKQNIKEKNTLSSGHNYF